MGTARPRWRPACATWRSLGSRGIRVNGLSAGRSRRWRPGHQDFGKLLADFAAMTPIRRAITIEDVGNTPPSCCRPGLGHQRRDHLRRRRLQPRDGRRERRPDGAAASQRLENLRRFAGTPLPLIGCARAAFERQRAPARCVASDAGAADARPLQAQACRRCGRLSREPPRVQHHQRRCHHRTRRRELQQIATSRRATASRRILQRHSLAVVLSQTEGRRDAQTDARALTKSRRVG